MIKKHIELIEMNQKSNREKNPNVVFIFADDLGYGDLSCYGATKIQTPHIDKIAEEGVSFTDAHSSSAVCTPSRYSVITGRYCWRTWLKKWVIFGHGLPLIEKDRKTIGDLFQENGYKTAAIGKWHLGLGWNFKEGFEKKKTQNHYDAVNYTKNLTHCPNDLGFDYFFGIAGSLDMYPYCFFENDHVYGDPPTKLKDTLYQQQRKGYQANNWKDEQVDITFTEKALQFIDKCHEEDPDKPFFLYLPTSSPHRPCDIQPEFVKGESEAGDRGDMVILFDWIVGQVEQKLQDLNLTDNTIFIISSDNGARLTCYNGKDYGHKSCGDLRGQKADIWEGGHREPFIVRWPGVIETNTECHTPICLVDLFATFAELFESGLEDNFAEDSFSFLRCLTENKHEMQTRPHLVHHSGQGMFSIRKNGWKMIKGLGSGGFTHWGLKDTVEYILDLFPKGQLYNLNNDLQEKDNLWRSERQKIKELSNLLEKIMNTPSSSKI